MDFSKVFPVITGNLLCTISPQLFSILAMKTYLKTTYREIIECLELMDKIRKFLGLNKLPHFTTIQKILCKRMSDTIIKRFK